MASFVMDPLMRAPERLDGIHGDVGLHHIVSDLDADDAVDSALGDGDDGALEDVTCGNLHDDVRSRAFARIMNRSACACGSASLAPQVRGATS